MAESLSKKQQELLDKINTPGVYVNEEQMVIGRGKYEKADTRTLDALYRRRLVRKLRNGKWSVTPAGRKAAKTNTGKDVSSEATKTIRGKNGIGKRGPLPGHGGKPKGAVRERTWNARDLMIRLEAELGRPVDPLEGMVRIAHKLEDAGNHSAALEAWKALAQYQYPKLSNIEHVGAGGGPVQHQHEIDVTKLTNKELDILEKLQSKMVVADAGGEEAGNSV